MTYKDLITAALRDLNICAATDDPDPADVQLGLDRLNDWIDALALEQLTIPQLVRQTWTLVSGTASYTVGSSQTVNIAKPVSPQAITNIGYYDNSVSPITEILFGRVLTNEEYELVAQKALQQTFPTGFWYDPTVGTTGTLYPLPIPNVSTLKGVIYAPGVLSEVALNDTVSLPQGYRRFIRTNLTVEIAVAFEKEAPSAIVKAAHESRRRVKAANLRAEDMHFEAGVPGLVPFTAYNINTDQ